jgi:hypothetical protein
VFCQQILCEPDDGGRVAQLRHDEWRRTDAHVGEARTLARDAQNGRSICEWLVAQDQAKVAQSTKAPICRPLAVAVAIRPPKEASSNQLGGDNAVPRDPTHDFDIALCEFGTASAPPRPAATTRLPNPVGLVIWRRAHNAIPLNL